jgi:hypothetical protein
MEQPLEDVNSEMRYKLTICHGVDSDAEQGDRGKGTLKGYLLCAEKT